MKIKSTINVLDDTRTGNSKKTGRPWASRDIVLEYKNEDGKLDTIAANAFGVEICERLDKCQLGDVIEADIYFYATADQSKTDPTRMYRRTDISLNDFKVLDEAPL